MTSLGPRLACLARHRFAALTVAAATALCIPATADAQEPGPLRISAGLAGLVRDPVVHRRGLSLGVAQALGQRLAIGARMSVFPNLGEGDWTALMRSIPSNTPVPLSRVMATAGLEGELHLLRERGDYLEGALSIYGQLGAVYTDDDLALAGTLGVAEAVNYEHQLHPAGFIGVVAGADREVVGLRVRVGFGAYTERIVLADSTSTPAREPRYPTEVGVEFRFRP